MPPPIRIALSALRFQSMTTSALDYTANTRLSVSSIAETWG